MEREGADFVSTICFVRRGVAKEHPEKVVLTPGELAQIISNTQAEIEDESDEERNETPEEMEVSDGENGAANPTNEQPTRNSAQENGDDNNDEDDQFDFSNYDHEETVQVAGISDVAVIGEDAHIPDEDDSEAEDDIIKPSDNLMLFGQIRDDYASLAVYIFNEGDECCYVHHDFMLPSYPLCIEWLSYDPGSDKDGNMCAIGSMSPVITIWDLDIEHSLEPIFKLGSKGNRKRNKVAYGHKDAVLSLSWNQDFQHVLASSSVDKSVILWDLDEGQPHTTITAFGGEVNTIQFRPTLPQQLLTGCADNIVRLFDCRDIETLNTDFKQWTLDSQIEKVSWCPYDDKYFMAGTNSGFVCYADIRKPGEFLWTKNLHEEEISGIFMNNESKNMLITSSTDGLMKIWKYAKNDIEPVFSKELKIGRIHCLASCPEDPYQMVFGGDSKTSSYRLLNVKNYEQVRSTFNLE